MTAELLYGAGFSVSVPPSWFELELAPATRDSALAELVDQRVADVPELREHRSTIARILRQQAREAWDSGARFCACMVEPDDEGPITASATVSVVRGPLGVRRGGQEHLDALLAPLQPKTAKDADDTWRSVAAVELGDGTSAARTWGVEDVDLPQDAGWMRVVSLLQLTPVPGTDRVVLLACAGGLPLPARQARRLLRPVLHRAGRLRRRTRHRAGPGRPGARAGPAGAGRDRQPDRAAVLRRWTPDAPEGPLGGLLPSGNKDEDALVYTFRSATYDEVLATQPRTVYRTFADHGTVNSQFWSYEPPVGPLQAQLDLALLPEWNASTRSGPAFTSLPQATHMAEATVPPGVVHFDGPTAPQVGKRAPETAVLGGAGQVVFPGGLPADWLKPGVQRVAP